MVDFPTTINTSSSTPPAPTAGTKGYPKDGTQGLGWQDGTPFDAFHWFAILSEFINVIVAAGITPSNTDLSQLLKALRVLALPGYGGANNSASSGPSLSTAVSFTPASDCLILVNANCGNNNTITNFNVTATGATLLHGSPNWGGGGTSPAINLGAFTGLFQATAGQAVTLTAAMQTTSGGSTLSVGLNYIALPLP